MGRIDSEPLIEKHWPSAFHKTDLDDQLRALGVDSLVVTGLTTSGCVRASAVDGLQNNYQVVIARDAVGDRNRAAHESNLFDLNAKYADVMSVAEIVAIL
jgi:maleamate amidohydrolase